MTDDIEKKIEKLNQEIKKAQAELAIATAEKKRLDALGPAYALAEYLHSKTCTLNHTDACGWFYETWGQGEQWTKARYLTWAKRIIKAIDKLRTEPTIATPLDLVKIVLETRYE